MNHKRSMLQTRGRNDLLESLKLGKRSQKNGEQVKYNYPKSYQPSSSKEWMELAALKWKGIQAGSSALIYYYMLLTCHYYCLMLRTCHLCIGRFPLDCELLGDSNPNLSVHINDPETRTVQGTQEE